MKRKRQLPVSLATMPGLAVAVRMSPGPEGRAHLREVRVLHSESSATERLDQLARELRIKQAPLQILLEAADYQFMQTEFPSLPVEELRTAIGWQMKDMLRQPLDQSTLDILPPPAQGDGIRRTQGYVVSAANNLLRSRMLQFRAYGSDVAVIDIPEQAQRNLADCLETPGHATAILALTPAGCLLTVSREGELYFVRNFELGGPLAENEHARREQFDRLVLELQRSFDVLEHQFSFLSLSTLWLAPFSHMEELFGLLIDTLYLPVKIVVLEELFDCRECPLPGDPTQRGALFHVLGLALRAVGEPA
ncbi:hypothetical protein [Candidatus Dactylopiibacterium carminicum]|uniref:hypothetical protein n=1 Tax=Candidatus Dactylopiibacterium carminicum TaxID=857335 RepID=UPI001178A39E|nr:hypothetical protein [Candidatus Dactylopiibacterium carminicum]